MQNDSGFITESSIPTELNDLDNVGILDPSDGQYLRYDSESDKWINASGTPGGSGTSNYSDLSNKPKINNVELSGNKTLANLGIAAESHTHTVDDIIDFPEIPESLSDLIDDEDHRTVSDDDIDNWNGKAESDDIPTKVSDIDNDLGFITSDDVPTKTSELTNDSGFTTKTYVDNTFEPKKPTLYTHSVYVEITDKDGTSYHDLRINMIVQSDEAAKYMNILRDYMFEAVYRNPRVKQDAELEKIQTLIFSLYDYYMAHEEELPAELLELKAKDGLNEIVKDHIAGMTDRYAINLYGELFVPAGWKLRR